MQISDFLKIVCLTAAGFLLAACDPSLLNSPAVSRTTVNVAGQAFTVSAPGGFCIDKRSTSINRNGAFVLMSDCVLLGGRSTQPNTMTGAALTASISAGGLGGEGDDSLQSLMDLKEFITTPEGLALLGHSGQSKGVRVLSQQQKNEVLYVLVEDRGPQPIAGIERRFWRAFLDLEDHLAVLSVLGFEGAGVGSQQGLNLLSTLAGSLQRAN